MKVEQNISRLNYLLKLYKMTVDDLLFIINKGLKKALSKNDIFSNEIKISHLKKIDKIFNKGLHFYLDPKSPETTKDASIFFRKEKFGTDINMATIKIVNKFEELKISLSTIAKLSEFDTERILPVYNINQNAQIIAQNIRETFNIQFIRDKKKFLNSLINKLAEYNILVFEFIENWNQEKVNIDGFFLNPNVIVLKRTSFRREIFTLIHELGHFLINEEEIDRLELQDLANTKLNAIERWCNDFAYYFLVDKYDNLIESIDKADGSNDYHYDIITEVSERTHLSTIALFTRLLYQNKISQNNYNIIKIDLEEKYRLKKEKDSKIESDISKINNFRKSKAINSPLLISTVQTAFYEGIVNELYVCEILNIKPDKLEKYL